MKYVALGFLLGILLSTCNDSQAAEIEPLITAAHTSDLLRGRPFNSHSEPTEDYIGFGVTISFKKVEVDLTHGAKTLDCRLSQGCKWESGTKLALRWYPRRKR